MKLIEKECPNCGASLSFTKDDTSCKCEYCKREFEIERDTDKAKALVDQFNLIPIKSFAKFFGIFTIGSFITTTIITILIIGVFVLVFLGILNSASDQSIFKDDTKLVTKEKDLTDRDLDTLDINSKIAIMKANSNLGDFTLKGVPSREKVYIISKDEENIIISVYKTTYQNFFQNEFTYTIYVPVKYNNVKSKGDSIAFSIGNGTIEADEYYFNLEHSDYAYGYQDLDTLNTEINNKYKDYTIVEK